MHGIAFFTYRAARATEDVGDTRERLDRLERIVEHLDAERLDDRATRLDPVALVAIHEGAGRIDDERRHLEHVGKFVVGTQRNLRERIPTRRAKALLALEAVTIIIDVDELFADAWREWCKPDDVVLEECAPRSGGLEVAFTFRIVPEDRTARFIPIGIIPCDDGRVGVCADVLTGA